MDDIDLENIKGELPVEILEKLIEIYHKPDSTLWSKRSNQLTQEQLRQVLNEVTARQWAKSEAEYAALTPAQQQAQDDAYYRAGGRHYARDNYYVTIFQVYDMVNGEGAYENSSLDNVLKVMPKLYEKVMKRKAYMTESEQFHYFSSEDSFLANAFPATFRVEQENLSFGSALHYMMYAKAELFRDRKMMPLLSKGTLPKNPLWLGKRVKLFNRMVWEMKVGDFLETALKEKFTQNEALKKQLLATKGETLVLSCAKDQVWGIGLSAEDAQSKTRKTWQGKNLLGEALTNLRIELAGEY